MATRTRLELEGFTLTDAQERRIRRHLGALEHRLEKRPEATALLALEEHRARRQVEADLHVRLGPLGPSLVSHQAAETADRAARLAVEDVQRQLERQVARQRGEPTFGVPSRREPARLRPGPPQPAGLEE